MREITWEIPDFNILYLREEADEEDSYINLCITLHDNRCDFQNKNSPFFKLTKYHIVPFTEDYQKIKIRLRHNDKIDKDLEFLFMNIDNLCGLCGTITPLQYKIKLIESLSLFED